LILNDTINVIGHCKITDSREGLQVASTAARWLAVQDNGRVAL
jgi:hypothetical protein